MNSAFNYDLAFSRNIGWLTTKEQSSLRNKRVAIAGMGGVGGFHLLSMARLGFERFNIADFDHFELANFNRQAGAGMSTLGKPKVEILAEQARDINPSMDVRIFSGGVNEDNLSEFFAEVDIYIDGLDFFAFQARELIFAFCAKQDIPAITAAPLGMSSALLNFLPGSMGFEDYFQLANHPELEKAVRFLVGLAPRLIHRHYLIEKNRVDLRSRKGPSTVIACQLCAGMATAEALKILLRRGKVLVAPHAIQFDGYYNKLAHTWRPGGNRHILNRLAIAIAKNQLGI